jgi:hypothetical protein
MSIKKFNELYGPDNEMDRDNWPNAPEISDPIRSDREKLSTINNLYLDMKSNRLSSNDFIKEIGKVLSTHNDDFPGSYNL